MKIILCMLLVAYANLQAQELSPVIEWKNAKDTLIINRAINFYDTKRYNEAIKELKKLPNKYYLLQPGVLRLNGLCHYQQENYYDAIIAFSLALAYAPDEVGTYYNRAFALMDWGKYKAAASDFAAYAIHFPDSKSAVLNAADCLASDGQMDAAIKYLEKYDDKDTLVYNSLALFYSDQLNHEKAIEQLEKALLLNPYYVTGIENLAIEYSEIKNYKRAFELIEKLISFRPNYGRAYYLQGVFYEETGDDSRAEECFELAREKGYEWD